MNAVQFGRWFSERRRAGGWPSQRLLAEAAQQHTMVCQSSLSEDFLSRLEAGHLAHPFRGTVRRRILLLAWLLCKTPRDLKTYLKAAGLNKCSDDETDQLRLLREHLVARQTPPPLLLPARPTHLKGRDLELEQVMSALSNPETRIFALTGMPGVGKSVLAHEALHRLVTTESERLRHFPDGIATFTCTGRRGTRGLISLLNEITALFTTDTHVVQGNTGRHGRAQKGTSDPALEHVEDELELASVLDRARAALANKRALLLLDDLDPAFPLRQASDVLLAQGSQTLHEARTEYAQYEQRVIFTTSQFIPAPALVSTHLHVQPLSEAGALELLSELLGEELRGLDLVYTRQACAAVGYLPLAIEGMATAIQADGIPLPLVATHLNAHPLGGLLDGEEEVVAKIEKALAGLEQAMRTDYLLLAALELPDFDLETAAAVLAPQPLPISTPRLQPEPVGAGCSAGGVAPQPALATRYAAEQAREHLAHLADTAAVLGHFVRSSLLELVPGSSGNDIRYHMHPLLYHCSREMAYTVPGERWEIARDNLLAHTRLSLSQRKKSKG